MLPHHLLDFIAASINLSFHRLTGLIPNNCSVAAWGD
jgi:hypothetical protein